MKRVLAFDFGASSGRAMLGEYDGGRLALTELHRFTNDPVKINGTLYWDILRLFYDVKKGITAAVNAGGFDSIGIDTWGVDFGLVDKNGDLVENPVHYRDERTDAYRELDISEEDMYGSTGIQVMQINTIYQLHALVKYKPDRLKAAYKVLFMPDLLNYLLCGEMKAEYTIASTSQLLDAKTRDWDYGLIERVGLSKDLFCEIVHPGAICGYLRDDIAEELGAPKAAVINIGSHDTASAVVSVPAPSGTDFIYISSGTWSLLGAESEHPIITEKSRKYNFTNEGGVNKTIRFLKNIMGTWLIQESRRQWIREGKEYSFGELEEMAKGAEPLKRFIDVDNPVFAKPGNMPRRIAEYCQKTGQSAPQTPGEFIRCIDESLALKYRYTIDCIEDCTGKKYDTINIVGGGVKSALLCQMAADATGREVIAGPDEATVYGNACIQLMAAGVLKTIDDVRDVVKNSCELQNYKPAQKEVWDQAYKRYCDTVLTAEALA